MLLFTRDAFASGRMYIRVSDMVWVLKPSDKNTVVDFGEYRDEVLAKYPAFFSIPA